MELLTKVMTELKNIVMNVAGGNALVRPIGMNISTRFDSALCFKYLTESAAFFRIPRYDISLAIRFSTVQRLKPQGRPTEDIIVARYITWIMESL